MLRVKNAEICGKDEDDGEIYICDVREGQTNELLKNLILE